MKFLLFLDYLRVSVYGHSSEQKRIVDREINKKKEVKFPFIFSDAKIPT